MAVTNKNGINECTQVSVSMKILVGGVLSIAFLFNSWMVSQVTELQKAVIDNQKTIAVIINEQKNYSQMIYKYMEKQ